jgi:two-component system sensor histidine kinase FlrB
MTSAQTFEPGELQEAFSAFNQMSSQLEGSYRALEARLARLTAELAQARAERELQARQAAELAQRLGTLLATLPGGVVVLDTSGRIQESNPAARVLLGDPLEGQAWHRVVARVFQEQRQPNGDLLTRDGRRVALKSNALDNNAGKILLLNDVSDTRALEALVNRNSRLSAMGQMAASLAHQIRTPLAAALLYLSQCRDCTPDPVRQADLLERGIARLSHLDHMVHDMLVFARGSGPGEQVRIADLFREVHQAVASLKPASAHLVIEGGDVLCQVAGNSTALVAALVNLINNAFEAAPEGVVVTVKAEVRGDQVEFSVSDNGPGISPALRSKVFEPFFSTRPSGTGLGLAVVKTVTEAHGGELAVSCGSRQGTTIGLTIPAERSGSHRDLPLAAGAEV